jgi:hypothetical protein
MIAPIRTFAPVGDAASADAAADEAPMLRVFWYPLDSAEIDDQTEPLPHALAELVGAAHRLDVALGELRALAGVRDVTGSIDSIEFRLENFAGRLGELRERLLRLPAHAARHPSSHLAPARPGNGSAAPNADLVAPVERILALIDDDLPLRDPQARRTFLHLSLCIAGALHDPGDTGASLPGGPDERRRLNRRLRREIRDIVAVYAGRVARIVELVVDVLDQAAGGSLWR